MKTKIAILCWLHAIVLSIVANAEPALLLMGEIRGAATYGSPITGAKKAIIKAGADEIRVSADQITFDPTRNALMCVGTSSVVSGDRTISGDNLKIELGSRVPRIFILNPEGVSVGERRSFESWKPSTHLPQFQEQLPITELKINPPNKSLEPTPTSVTPPAAQESRRP